VYFTHHKTSFPQKTKKDQKGRLAYASLKDILLSSKSSSKPVYKEKCSTIGFACSLIEPLSELTPGLEH